MIKQFQGEYRFLSNFWLVKVLFEGKIYSSVEHAYQAAKTLDPKIREIIRNLSSPGMAKRYARKIELRPDWEKVKLGIMESLVRYKFLNNSDLMRKLKATGSEELIEGNLWGDTYWGVYNGKGENHLGKILMKIREE